jgi:hypothetical protein
MSCWPGCSGEVMQRCRRPAPLELSRFAYSQSSAVRLVEISFLRNPLIQQAPRSRSAYGVPSKVEIWQAGIQTLPQRQLQSG